MRNREQFTREVAAKELLAARQKGVEAGKGASPTLSDDYRPSSPFEGLGVPWTEWRDLLSDQWKDGFRTGLAAHKQEIREFTAGEVAKQVAAAVVDLPECIETVESAGREFGYDRVMVRLPDGGHLVKYSGRNEFIHVPHVVVTDD